MQSLEESKRMLKLQRLNNPHEGPLFVRRNPSSIIYFLGLKGLSALSGPGYRVPLQSKQADEWCGTLSCCALPQDTPDNIQL